MLKPIPFLSIKYLYIIFPMQLLCVFHFKAPFLKQLEVHTPLHYHVPISSCLSFNTMTLKQLEVHTPLHYHVPISCCLSFNAVTLKQLEVHTPLHYHVPISSCLSFNAVTLKQLEVHTPLHYHVPISGCLSFNALTHSNTIPICVTNCLSQNSFIFRVHCISGIIPNEIVSLSSLSISFGDYNTTMIDLKSCGRVAKHPH